MEDLREECGKHGALKDVRVPRPDNAATQLGQGCWGKVFVLMETAAAAEGVHKALHGRMYDAVQVRVDYIDQSAFYQLPF